MIYIYIYLEREHNALFLFTYIFSLSSVIAANVTLYIFQID